MIELTSDGTFTLVVAASVEYKIEKIPTRELAEKIEEVIFAFASDVSAIDAESSRD